MRRHAIRLVALGAVLSLLTWARGAESPDWKADEANASLFGDETVTKSGSNVERTANSVDVGATVATWEHADRTAAANSSKVLVSGLLALTTIATTEEDPPKSVSISTTAEGSGCSTTETGRTAGQNGPSGCSVQSQPQNTSACSTNDTGNTDLPFGPPVGATTCSLSTNTSTTKTCSANVPPGGKPVNNTTCSALGDSATAQTCSAGYGANGGGPLTCSTGGGQSNPGNSTGAVGCSASGNSTEKQTNICSASDKPTKDVSCSTYTGEHQSCSAGNVGKGEIATCSAQDSSFATCSVQASSGGLYGNQCTANSYNNPDNGGQANCSVAQKTNGSCSVAAGTTNTQCTTFTNQKPSATVVQCSAFTSPGVLAPNPPGGQCSVINKGGDVTPPKAGQTTCGGPYKGEGG
jgi:hypothetical protein